MNTSMTTPMTKTDEAAAIYGAYPRKAAPLKARAAILKALKLVPYERLLERVKRFAELTNGADKQFLPYPATWFNQGRWDDDEDEWRRAGRDGRSAPFNQVSPYTRLQALKTELEVVNRQLIAMPRPSENLHTTEERIRLFNARKPLIDRKNELVALIAAVNKEIAS